MNTQVTYKISKVTSNYTIVHEFWNDILVFKWHISTQYKGGNIEEFLERNKSIRNPIFDGIDEYHRRTFILF